MVLGSGRRVTPRSVNQILEGVPRGLTFRAEGSMLGA